MVRAYVFITTKQPCKTIQEIRRIPGVVNADALFGLPDAIAVMEGEDIPSVDRVMDRICKLPEVDATNSRVAQWVE